jgi:hypothetical protein
MGGCFAVPVAPQPPPEPRTFTPDEVAGLQARIEQRLQASRVRREALRQELSMVQSMRGDVLSRLEDVERAMVKARGDSIEVLVSESRWLRNTYIRLGSELVKLTAQLPECA